MRKKGLCNMRGILYASFCALTSGVLVISGLTSCNADDVGNRKNAGEGYVSLSVETDTTYVVTKASSDPKMPDDYQVSVLQGEEVITSFRFGDKPELLPLDAGDYVAKASWGRLLPAAFDSLYMEGTSVFTIKEGTTTPVSLACKPANAKITVDYTDALKQAYSDYSVTMSTSHTGKSPLKYVKDESRAGYFQANADGEKLSLAMLFETRGKEYEFSQSIDIKPRDFVRLHFKLGENDDDQEGNPNPEPNPDPDPTPDPDPEPDVTPAPELSINVAGLMLMADGSGKEEVLVESNAEWTVSNTAEWLTVEKGTGKAILSATPNEVMETRSETVTFTAVKENKTTSVKLYVVQLPKEAPEPDNTPKLFVNIVDMIVPSDGFTQDITVSSTDDWTFTNSAEDWLKVVRPVEDNNKLSLSAVSNATPAARKGTVTLTAMNEEGQSASVTITVEQKAKDEDPWIKVDFSGLRIPAQGFTNQSYNVETNQSDWTVQSSADWLKAQKSGAKLILSVDANSTKVVRSATVMLTATKGDRTITVEMTVTQDPLPLRIPPLVIEIFINRADSVVIEKSYVLTDLYSTEKSFNISFSDGLKSGDIRTVREGTSPKDYYLNIMGVKGGTIQKCEWATISGFTQTTVDLADTSVPGYADLKNQGLVWDKVLKGRSLATIYLEKFVKQLPRGDHQLKLIVTGGGTDAEDLSYSKEAILNIRITE